MQWKTGCWKKWWHQGSNWLSHIVSETLGDQEKVRFHRIYVCMLAYIQTSVVYGCSSYFFIGREIWIHLGCRNFERLVDLLFNRSYWHYEIHDSRFLLAILAAQFKGWLTWNGPKVLSKVPKQQDTQWLKDTLSQLSDNEAMSVALDWTWRSGLFRYSLDLIGTHSSSQWSSMIINDHWGNPSMHQPWLSCTIMTCSPCGSERATSPTLQKSVVHGEAAMHIWCLLYLFLYLPILDLPLENGLFQLKAAANHKITSLCTTKKGFQWTPLQIDSSASKLHNICGCRPTFFYLLVLS